jgi:hypothetical protein
MLVNFIFSISDTVSPILAACESGTNLSHTRVLDKAKRDSYEAAVNAASFLMSHLHICRLMYRGITCCYHLSPKRARLVLADTELLKPCLL